MLGTSVGPYQILERLGAGGMGEVFLGHDPRLERRVALKCLTIEASVTPEDQTRVLREARAVARLTHPHIAGVYDVLEQDGRAFIVMEYVEGVSLAAHLAAGPLPPAEVRLIGRQLASALAAAHAQGVVHRDLKPANIQVMRDGSIKVLDFGVARLMPSLQTVADTTVGHEASPHSLGGNPGTALYMAPEQLINHVADVRSDLYSAGVILFQMATGRRPYLETTAVTLALAMTAGPAPAARAINHLVPLELSETIGRALKRNPDHRYQSARELDSALASMSGTSSSTREVNVQVRDDEVEAARARRRWPLAAAAAVVLAIGAVWALPLLTRVGPAWLSRSAPPVAMDPGIAVLPLANLSGDVEQEYIADGMTEAIIAELGRVRSLRVISRQSVMRYKKTTATVPQIAGELGVGAVITGSVTRAGDQVHVTVALMQSSPERQLWSATYDRGVGDMLTLSGQVAQAAVQQVRASVTPQEQARLETARPVNPAAYQAYLLGRYYWNKRSAADNARAIREFERAIGLDPNAALAFAGLADCYVVAWDNGFMPPEEAYRQAKSNATRAIELDDTIAEAHASLGSVYSFGLLWPAAEREYRRAIELNPGYATAYQWYALNLSRLGRHQEAVAEARHARDLDPLSRVQNAFLGRRLYIAGDYGAAAVQLRKTIALDPDFWTAHALLGLVLIEQGELAEAVKELERASALEGSVSGELGYGYGRAGNTAAATRVLNELQRQVPLDPYQIAFVHLGLGHRDQALDWFAKAYREFEVMVADLAVDPRLAVVSDDPRFVAMLQKSGLRFNPGKPH